MTKNDTSSLAKLAYQAVESRLGGRRRTEVLGKVNVTDRTLRNWKNGTNRPKKETVRLLLKELGVPEEDLAAELARIEQDAGKSFTGEMTPPEVGKEADQLSDRSDADAVRESCPFRGMETFRSEDAKYYFGREAEICALRKAMNQLSIIGIVAPSGAGKSSLVWAGLLPELAKEDRDWSIFAFQPGQEPVRALSQSLANSFGPYSNFDAKAQQITQRVNNFKSGRVKLRDLINTLQSETGPGPVVIFVDQWEQIFSLDKKNWERDVLLNELLDVTSRGLAKLVITVRSDFLGNIQSQTTEFFEALRPGLQFLQPMSRDQILQTITRSCGSAGLDLQDGLAERLADDAAGESGYLTYLQFALKQIWSLRVGNLLTQNAYDQLGGLRGAIGRHADWVMENLLSDEGRASARVVLPQLVHVSDSGKAISVRKPLASFGPSGQRLLSSLSQPDSRLVVILGREDSSGTFEPSGEAELAHEALLNEWDQLGSWIREREDFHILRGKVENDAARWIQSDRHPEYLIQQGRPLIEAQDLVGSAQEDDLTTEVLEYVAASCDQAEARDRDERDRLERDRENQQRLRSEAERRLKTTRRFLGAVAISAIALAVAGSVAVWQRQQVLAQQEILRNQQTTLEDRQTTLTRNQSAALSALAQIARREGRPVEAARLALAAWPQSGHDEKPTLRPAADVLSSIAPRLLELVRMEGHSDAVWDTQLSSDGRYLISHDLEGTARVWRMPAGTPISFLGNHEGHVKGMALSKNGERAITWDEGSTAYVWNAMNGERTLELSGHEKGIRGAQFISSETSILTWSLDGTLRKWDASSGTLLEILQGHDQGVNGATTVPGSETILSWANDATLRLWDMESGRTLMVFDEHAAPVTGASFSSDGQKILSWSDDGTAKIWDIEQDTSKVTMTGHEGGVRGAEFSQDNSRVLTWSFDNTIRLWDPNDGKWITTIEGPERGVFGATFSPDGTQILSWGREPYAEPNAKLWSAKSGAEIATLEGHGGGVGHAEFSADGQYVLTGSQDDTARLWHADTGAEIATLAGHTSFTRARFIPNTRSVLTWSGDGSLRIWDTGRVMSKLRIDAHSKTIWGYEFRPDHTHILTWSGDRTAKVWDRTSGEAVFTLIGHTDGLAGATYNARGTKIMTWSHDKTARVWSALDGTQITTFRGHQASVTGAFFGPDDKRVLAWSRFGSANLWSAEDGELMHSFGSNKQGLMGASFSGDAKQILTWYHDGSAILWNTESGVQIAVLEGHEDIVVGGMFSMDGASILTWSIDGTARVWSAENGGPKFVLTGADGAIGQGATYSPDGQTIFTWSGHGALWSAATGEMIARVNDHWDISGAVFSPNSQKLLTWVESVRVNTARLWDSSTGEPIATLRGHEREISGARFNDEGSLILTWAKDGSARLWDAESGAALNILDGGDSHFVMEADFDPIDPRVITVESGGRLRFWDISDLTSPRAVQTICSRLPNLDLGQLANEYELTLDEGICQNPESYPPPYFDGYTLPE